MRDRRPLVLAATAIAVLAAIVILASLRPSTSAPTALASASPTVSASATAATTPSVAASVAPTAASSAGSAFTDAKYGFAVTLIAPYRLSTRLTRESPPIQTNGGVNSTKQAAQRDVFTAYTPSAEDAAMEGQDCEVQCNAWNGTVAVYVYTDAGSMTPRQWFDAGYGPGSPGRVTDTTLGGRPALRIEPAGRYNAMYIVADGKGQMFHVSYEFFHILAAPPGATIDKAEQIMSSFRFV